MAANCRGAFLPGRISDTPMYREWISAKRHPVRRTSGKYGIRENKQLRHPMAAGIGACPLVRGQMSGPVKGRQETG
jgi:hypothetical protein